MASPATGVLTDLKTFLHAEGAAGRIVPAPGYIGNLPTEKAGLQYPHITLRFTSIEEDDGSENAEASLSVTVVMEAANPENCQELILDYTDAVRKAINRKSARYPRIKQIEWKSTSFNALRNKLATGAFQNFEVAELEFDCKIRQKEQQP